MPQNIRLFADNDAITPAALNERIKALAGCSYSADAPTSPLDYQLWIDSDASPRTLNVWIPSTGWVTINADITTADLSDTSYLALSGGTMTGPIAMGTSKITGLGAATADTDALSRTAGDSRFLQLAGGTMTGAIAMGTSKITGLGNATAAQDAMTKANFDGKKLVAPISIPGIAATGNYPLSVGSEASFVIVDVVLVSGTATAASDGTNNYTFQVRNVTQSLDLRSAVKTTNGAEIAANTAYALGLDQNLTIAANDVLQLQVVKNATPTDLTSARLIAQVNYKLTI